MKNVLAIIILSIGSAQAGTFSFSGTDWIRQDVWSFSVPVYSGPGGFDNGDALPLSLGTQPWTPAVPATATGWYAGSFTYDDSTGEITGGSIVVTGFIAQLSNDSLLLHLYDNIVWNFNDGTTTVGSYSCHTGVGTLPCDFEMSAPNALTMSSGYEGASGNARYAARFDAVNNNIELFSEGYDDNDKTGVDYLHVLGGPGISGPIVPLPAAAWLFSSALLGLGWLRGMRS